MNNDVEFNEGSDEYGGRSVGAYYNGNKIGPATRSCPFLVSLGCVCGYDSHHNHQLTKFQLL